MCSINSLKNNYKKRFEHQTPITISVHQSNLKWEAVGKEAEINGSMFDVVSYTVVDDHIILSGWYDHKEDALHELLKQKHKKKQDKENTSLVQFNYAFCDSFFLIHFSPPFSQKLRHLTSYHKNLSVGIITIPNPPPQFFI
jgi:hypothetical protein